jgi:hypothetical protein
MRPFSPTFRSSLAAVLTMVAVQTMLLAAALFAMGETTLGGYTFVPGLFVVAAACQAHLDSRP